jgi:hypothetical protein
MATSVIPPFPLFLDTNGQPLENGFIYIGTEFLDPVTNPIQVYWDADLTIAASQPIRTIEGYPSRSGSPSAMFVPGNYSITVKDKKNRLVYSSESVQGDTTGAAFTQPFTGAVETTPEEFYSRYASLFDFMTEEEIADAKAGTRLVDHTAAVQAAMDWAHHNHGGRMMTIHCPAGRYNISQIHGKMHARFVGEGEGTTHSASATQYGFQTEFYQLASANGNLIYYDIGSSDDPLTTDSRGISDISWERMSFRGNAQYGGTSDLTGNCFYFDDVTPIQGVHLNDLVIQNFSGSGIRGTRHFLPATLTNIWAKYVNFALHVSTNSTGRITHMFSADRIQGDFLVGGLIKIDMSNQIAASGSGGAETYLFSNLKHEIDSSATAIDAYSPDTIILHNMDRPVVTVLNADTQASNPLGGGIPNTNSIVKITGTVRPHVNMIGCRMGSSNLVADYLIDDQVSGITIPKNVRNAQHFVPVENRIVGASNTTVFENTYKMTSAGALDANPRFKRSVDGKMNWGDGTDPTDTVLYRNGVNRLYTEGGFQAQRLMARGGTALVAGDFSLSAGWGATASISVDSRSTDQRFRITVTCSGAGILANPTITLTFHDGPFTGGQKWVVAPVAVASMSHTGSGTISHITVGSASVNTLELKYAGTPVDTKTYVIDCIMLG